MNRQTHHLHLIIIFFVAGLLLTPPCTAQLRTWTSVSQHTVDATLVTQRNGNVILKKPDGEEITIPLTVLSQADQDYVKRASIIPAKTPDRLPLLANTTWTMNLTPRQNRSADRLSQEIEVYMIYEGSTYTAAMGETGRLYIQPKAPADSPYRVNAPMTIGWGHSYKQGSTYVSREKVKYVDTPDPQWNPTSVKLKAQLEDESVISIHIDFTPASFTVHSFLTDPPDIKTPTLFGWGFGIPASHDFPMGMEWEESKDYLKEGEIRLETLDGREKLDLVTGQNLSKLIKKVEEKNRWKDRKVTIENENEKGTVEKMTMNNYTGRPLYHGYTLQSKNNTVEFQSGETSKRLNPASFKVTIE